MINVRSAVVASAPGTTVLVKHKFSDFAKACKANGNTLVSEILNPAPGKAPCFIFQKPGTEEKVFVILSRGVSKLRQEGKMSNEALKGLWVIDGVSKTTNQPQWYLSRNGITQITVDEAIAQAEAVEAQVAKLSAEKLTSLIS